MSLRMFVALGAGLFVLGGLSLSQENGRPEKPATKAGSSSTTKQAGKSEKRERFTVIGYLEKRDRVITIKSGPKGTVYSVATKDGKVLHENLSAEQLKAQSPEIHEVLKTGLARDGRVRSTKVDASLRP